MTDLRLHRGLRLQLCPGQALGLHFLGVLLLDGSGLGRGWYPLSPLVLLLRFRAKPCLLLHDKGFGCLRIKQTSIGHVSDRSPLHCLDHDLDNWYRTDQIKSYKIGQIRSNQIRWHRSDQIRSDQIRSDRTDQIRQIRSDQTRSDRTNQIEGIRWDQIRSDRSQQTRQIRLDHIRLDRTDQIIRDRSNQIGHIRSDRSNQIRSNRSDQTKSDQIWQNISPLHDLDILGKTVHYIPVHDWAVDHADQITISRYGYSGVSTGWFKHKPPNSFRCQCPRRFLRVRPWNFAHVFSVPLPSL